MPLSGSIIVAGLARILSVIGLSGFLRVPSLVGLEGLVSAYRWGVYARLVSFGLSALLSGSRKGKFVTPLHFRRDSARPIVEEDRAEDLPNLLISPVFTEDVSRIFVTSKVLEDQHVASDCFPHSMKGKSAVALLQAGVWDGTAFNDRLVIAKQVGLALDRDSKVPQRNSEVGDLIHGSFGRHEFRTVSSCFHSTLLLGVPIDDGSIHEMEDSRDGTTC